MSDVMKTVIVSGIPRDTNKGMTLLKLKAHFMKRKHGGGEVRGEIVLSEDGSTATIEFTDPQVAVNVLEHEHNFNGSQLHVQQMRETSDETHLPPFSQIRAILSDQIVSSLGGHMVQFLQELKSDTGVTVTHMKKDDQQYYTIQGDYIQFQAVEEFIRRYQSGKQ